MLGLFKKHCIGLLSVILLSTINCSLTAWECCDTRCNRLYIGAFGGGLYSESTKISQKGTAFFSEDVGGPLSVDARGHAKKTSTGFGGLQIGYEWSQCPNSCWSLAPAAEIEAFWYSHTRKGHFVNTTDLDRLPEHDFVNSFHIKSGVYLVNAILSLNNSWGITPYVGVGLGATRLSLKNAKSIQVDPPERGINHFNSSRNDSSWAFAGQIKGGLRYKICSFHIFGEYRFVYVDSSNYIFGATEYPNHAHTSPWNVKIQKIQYNAFAVGIQYDL